MLRFLLLVLLGAAIYSLWKRTMRRFERSRDAFKDKPAASKKQGTGSVSELVQDPVCKLYLTKEKAISSGEHYFCSEKCRSEFSCRQESF